MSNPNKRKGTAWESAIRDYATSLRHKAIRPAQVGSGDIGDVHIDGLLCVQAKDVTSWNVSGWMTDVSDQATRAGLPFGAVVMKKRRAKVEDAYAVMTYATVLELLWRIDTAERLVKADPYIRGFWERAMEDRHA